MTHTTVVNRAIHDSSDDDDDVPLQQRMTKKNIDHHKRVNPIKQESDSEDDVPLSQRKLVSKQPLAMKMVIIIYIYKESIGFNNM